MKKVNEIFSNKSFPDCAVVLGAIALGLTCCQEADDAVDGGRPIAESNDPRDIVVDASGVYWLDRDDHAIYHVDHSGGDIRTVYTDDETLFCFDVDDTHMFVMTDYHVKKVDKRGQSQNAAPINQNEAHLWDLFPHEMEIDRAEDGYVYWNAQVDDRVLFRLPKTGGIPEVMYNGVTWNAMVSDEGDLYFGTEEGDSGSVKMFSKGSTDAVTVKEDQSCVTMRLEGDWMVCDYDSINKTSGKKVDLLNMMQITLNDTAIHEGYVVFGHRQRDETFYRMARIPVVGGEIEQIAVSNDGIEKLSVFDRTVYWTTTEGRILAADF